MDDTLGEALSSMNQDRQPKLRASCDVCAAAKVNCSKERPICERCFANGFECNYSPSMKLGKPARRSDLNVEGTPPREVSKIRLSDQLPTTTPTADEMIHVDPLYHTVEQSEQPREFTNSSDATPPALGLYTFRWGGPANEVFVTGTFDDWSKSVKLDKRADVFEKAVKLPKMRTEYKFVVDGQWIIDGTARVQEFEQGLYNNLLLPEDIADDRWSQIRRSAVQRTVQFQSEDSESNVESIEERVARIKVRVAELTRSEKEPSFDDPPIHVLTAENLELNEESVQTESSGTLQEEATSANPKLDRVLAQVDDPSMRHILERHDVSDLWLPIPRQTVKRLLADERKTKAFLHAQDDVLDSGFQLLNNTPSLSVHAPSHTTIDDDEGLVTELRVLGEGACGIVEEVEVTAMTSTTTVTCVRKRIARPRQLKALKQIMAAFAREVSVMRQVDHHHCVRFIGSYTDVDHINILSSPVADMDLATFLDLPIHDKERDILYRGFGCLCNAINYLHQKNIRHEDLKPQNVLIHGDNILLTDFGFSLDFSEDSMSTTTGRPSAWTVRYSAPEVLDFEARNRATDIWSLGCILLEMVSAFNGTRLSDLKDRWKHTGTGQSSFARNNEAARKWFKDEIAKPSLLHTIRHLCFLIRSMLNENRIYRPTAQQIVDRIFDISSLTLFDGNKRITPTCHGPTPCIGLSYSEANRKYPLLTVRTIDLMKYLHPNRYVDWRWGIFDLDWNPIDSDASYVGRSAPWSQVFSENAHIIKAACDEIYETANRSGTTRAHWSVHQKANSSALSTSIEGRLHARSSAMTLTAKHAVFRRLTLHSSFWADSRKEQSGNLRSVQCTLLPINLAKSPYFGSFFWKLSWPRNRQAVELDDRIRDLTSMDWPQ